MAANTPPASEGDPAVNTGSFTGQPSSRRRPRALTLGGLELSGAWLLAPMAGVTDWPCRSLALEQGAALTYSEMVSAEGLVRGGKETLRLLDRGPTESPFAVQIFGAKPETMAHAAALVEDRGADLIDLNMGCPVKKVCRSGAGAALLLKPDLLESIVRVVVRRVSIPVQVKVRLGWDAHSINIIETARRVEAAGAAALTIHGRTRAQHYSGKARWEPIAEAKLATSEMKVVGNGDITTAREALEHIEQYGVDAVMIGRAACGNPWIFSEVRALAAGNPAPPRPSREEWKATILGHLDDLVLSLGGDSVRAVRRMRKHLVWYSRGLPGAVSFRSALDGIVTREDVADALDAHFPASDSLPKGTTGAKKNY